VDGARTPQNATSIAANRNRSVSPMLSAPATIPASTDITFAPRVRAAALRRTADLHPVGDQGG
jgi:hypothetical protein